MSPMALKGKNTFLVKALDTTRSETFPCTQQRSLHVNSILGHFSLIAAPPLHHTVMTGILLIHNVAELIMKRLPARKLQKHQQLIPVRATSDLWFFSGEILFQHTLFSHHTILLINILNTFKKSTY